MKRIIINADDFGYSDDVNRGISTAFKRGLINSASIMTNMDSYKEAISICYKENLKSKIGLHVSLTEGRSITDLSSTGLVDERGFFIKENICSLQYFISKNTRKLVRSEIVRQLEILLQDGFWPTHINSHHHIHTLPWLAPLFIQVAREYSIPLRIAQTWSKGNLLIDLYRKYLNKKYVKGNLAFSDCFETFCSIKEKSFGQRSLDKRVEIMVHPSENPEGELFDTLDGCRYSDIDCTFSMHLNN